MLNQSEMIPFVIALALVVVMALLEVISMAFGAALSGFVDGLLPDFDFDADLDADAAGVGLGMLTWFKVGQVPVLIILVSLILVFGIVGIVMQLLISKYTGEPLPAGTAVAVALPLCLPPLKLLLELIDRIMPGEETDAVSNASLVGLSGSVVLGTAQQGSPAQAKVRNDKGQTHYVMVEPFEGADPLTQGMPILLVEQRSGVYLARPT